MLRLKPLIPLAVAGVAAVAPAAAAADMTVTVGQPAMGQLATR